MRTRTVSTAALPFAMLLIASAIACGPKAGEPAAPPAGQKKSAGQPSAAVPEPARLVGRWTRTEGGYVLEIRSVSPQGELDASYLNPRPIHVAKPEATPSGSTLTVYIELRDVNYPGSSYSLWYDAERDRLEGTYFQAVEQQTFNVSFERR